MIITPTASRLLYALTFTLLASLVGAMPAQAQGKKVGVSHSSSFQEHNVRGIVICTILANEKGEWPGKRPEGMLARLGYPKGATPSDDQILFDVTLHVPYGPVILGLRGLSILAGGGGYVRVPAGGNLAKASWKDRKWLALAMLARSDNKKPVEDFNQRVEEERFSNELFGDWRLINKVMLDGAKVKNSQFVGKRPIAHHLTWAGIGPTKLKFRTTVIAWTLVKPFGIPIPVQIVVPPALVEKIAVPNAFPTDEFGNARIYRGVGVRGAPKAADKVFAHRNAARIGPLLRMYESYIMNEGNQFDVNGNKKADDVAKVSPFFSELAFYANGSKLEMRDYVCSGKSHFDAFAWDPWKKDKNWPTYNVYRWEPDQNRYKLAKPVRKQIASPFEGFIVLPNGESK